MLEQRVDGFLVALHDVEHARRQARVARAAPRAASDVLGSRSLGFSTNVLPQAIATGNIHIGTIAGKLNGVMPTHTPSGLAQRPVVDVAADVVAVLAFEQLRNAARELDDLEAARQLAVRVGEHLAVLARDERGELVEVRVEQLLEAEHHAGPFQRARVGPAWASALAAATARATTAASANTLAIGVPVAGLNTGAERVPPVGAGRRCGAR